MIVTSGAISNYKDSGYTISTPFYDETGTNNPFGTYVNSSDIYINNPSIGVYMINGGYETSGTTIYPIYGSVSLLSYISLPTDSDNAYLVYPGYGFQVFADSNYTGTSSFIYYNTSSVPYVFYGSSSGSFHSKLNTCQILSTSGAQYGTDKTSSIALYYRGTQVATIFG